MSKFHRQGSDLVAADIEKHQLQNGEIPGQIDELIVAQGERTQIPQIAQPGRKMCDLVTGGIELGQLLHPTELVRKRDETVVRNEQHLQRQKANFAWHHR